jgi:PIN domain nuclease of toxin-antitoxin system
VSGGELGEVPPQRIPGNALGDPWDRVTGATAMALELPLVTRDQRITELDLVETIW